MKAGQSGGAAEISNVAGSSMSFVFSGDVVRWIGQRGPTWAIASVVIDGVDLGTVDTYWPSYVDQQVLFAAGGLGSGDHVLTITWEGLNPSAPAGSYVVVDAIEAAGSPVLSRFEESDGGFSVGSGWRSWVKAGQSGGAAEISNVAGSSMSVVFSGDVVRWIGQRGPTRAMASVVIDGVELGTVDTFWPSYVDQQVLFAAGGLGSGDHVLTITWAGLNPSAPAGSYVVVDAIEAAGSPVLSRFEESDGGFRLGRVGGRG